MDAMEKRYVGKVFVFHSPFEHTPGWEDSDVGIVVRRFLRSRKDPVDAEINDMWLGFNVESGEFWELWGLEMFDDKKIPVIPEHRALNWKPR